MEDPMTHAFVEGAKYRVRYRLDSQRVDREFVGLYLGWNQYGWHDLSLRPAAGTVTLPDDAIIEIEMVASVVACTQPVKVH